MNFQPIIDNLPLVFMALGFLLWGAARFVESKAKSNPAHDKWDDAAPWLTWASDRYSEAIDWLCEAKAISFKGKEKLVLLNKLTNDFQKNILAGNYVDAIASVTGYWRDARNKLLKVIPAQVGNGNPPQAQSKSPVFETTVGPNDQAGD